MHAPGSKMNKMKNCSRRLPYSHCNDCLPIRILEEKKCEYNTTCKFVIAIFLIVKIKSMFQKYLSYINDNPKGYWFKNKIYGWGWTPVTWQGWLVVLLYIAAIITLVSMTEESIPGNPDSGSNFLVLGGPVIVLTILLIFICYKKGEKPRWSWGWPKKK